VVSTWPRRWRTVIHPAIPRSAPVIRRLTRLVAGIGAT
jgi:hypothetical protein